MRTKILLSIITTIIFSGIAFSQVKLNAQADIGGTGTDNLQKISVADDGSIFVAGSSSSNHSRYKYDNSRGGLDYWVVKYTSGSGPVHVAWEKTIGGQNDDELISCVATTDGGCILGGRSRSTKSSEKSDSLVGLYDWWIVKLNDNGTIQWDTTIGSIYYDRFYSLDQTNDGGYILLGSYYLFNTTSSMYSIIKLNTNGNIEWRKDSFNYSQKKYYDYQSIEQTKDNGFLLTASNANGSSLFKLDNLGNILWTKDYVSKNGASGNYNIEAVETKDDNIILSEEYPANYESDLGGYNFHYVIFKTDNLGNQVWKTDNFFDASNNLCSVTPTLDSGAIAAFSHKQLPNTTSYDYYIQKFNKNGALQWTDTVVGNYDDYVSDIKEISPGRYIVGGNSASGIAYDKTKPNLGNSDYWLVAFTEMSFATNAVSSGVAFKSLATKGNMLVYPNPAKNTIYIQVKHAAEIVVMNEAGKILFTQKIQGNQTINISSLQQGIYYIRNNTTCEVRKIIKQ